MDAQARVLAQFLLAARYLAVFNALVWMAALAWTAAGWGRLLHLPLALILLYLHIRLDFDRRIFADFAQGCLQPEDFDAVLQQWSRIREGKPGSIGQRAAGVFKLWRCALWVTGLQAALLAWQLL